MVSEHELEHALSNLQQFSVYLKSGTPQVAAIGQELGNVLSKIHESSQEEELSEKQWMLLNNSRQLKGVATKLNKKRLVLIGNFVEHAGDILAKFGAQLVQDVLVMPEEEPMMPAIAVNHFYQSDDFDDAPWIQLPPTPPPPTCDWHDGGQ